MNTVGLLRHELHALDRNLILLGTRLLHEPRHSHA